MTAVGRNEPCPCGSGRKYKRCHGVAFGSPPEPESSRAALHARDERTVRDILAFGARRFGGPALLRAIEDLFGAGVADQPLSQTMLAYVLPFDGEPLAAHYLRASRVPADDRAWIERQLAAQVSVWEVLRVEPGTGVEVVDLLGGERCFVHEVLGSRGLAARDAVLARVVTDGVPVFCGMYNRVLPPAAAAEVVAGGARDGEALIAKWRAALALADDRARAPMTITNTDGDAAATIEDQLAVAKGAIDPVLVRLETLDGAVLDEDDRTGARLTFTRPGNAMHVAWENTVVGSARLTATRLVLTTNSVERGDALLARVRATLGDLATWKKRTRTELPAGRGGQRIAIDAQRTSTPEHMLTSDARGWLDTPIPSLGGATPRAAVADPDRRAEVHVLLKVMENQYARHPVGDIDVALLRRELGLDELGHPIAHGDLDRAVGSGRKLSETLLAFAQPELDAQRHLDATRMRGVLQFAVTVWNAVVFEDGGEAAGEVDRLRRDLATSAPAQILALFDTLVARKRARFGGDLRSIGEWGVTEGRGRLDVQTQGRVSNALHARLLAAGMMP